MIDQNVWMSMVGVPFLEKGRTLMGWDCWGAVAFGLQHGFGVTVPSYTEDYTTTHDQASVSALILRESIDWPEIPLAQAHPGDVIILRVLGQPWHCGLVVDPPHFVHAVRGAGTVRTRWDGTLWAHRIVGVHRHRQLMEPVCK